MAGKQNQKSVKAAERAGMKKKLDDLNKKISAGKATADEVAEARSLARKLD